MTPSRPQIAAIGEILWDELPTGRFPGGAPFNFAHHVHQLGANALMISRIGDDPAGEELRQIVEGLGLDDAFIQRDTLLPTGKVSVQMDGDGVPDYHIHGDVAYDAIAWDAEFDRIAPSLDVLCFGTLAQRSPITRNTIQRLIQMATSALIVYDINLRPPFVNIEIIQESLKRTHWLKLNETELPMLASMFDLPTNDSITSIRALRDRFPGIRLVCQTLGAEGCRIVTDQETITLPGKQVPIVDTIGAGDAFTAAFVCETIAGRSLEQAARFANALAAEVVQHRGGTPILRSDEIARMRESL